LKAGFKRSAWIYVAWSSTLCVLWIK